MSLAIHVISAIKKGLEKAGKSLEILKWTLSCNSDVFNSLPASGVLCNLLMIFTNKLDPDQARLNPYCLTLIKRWFFLKKKKKLKKYLQTTKKKKIPSMQRFNLILEISNVFSFCFLPGLMTGVETLLLCVSVLVMLLLST